VHIPTHLRRRRLPYWTTAGALALLTALIVGWLGSQASAERARWGTTRQAVVVTTSVRAGEPLEGHVGTRAVPLALLPRHALAALPRRAVAAADLAPGEIVVAHRLTGRSAVASRVPAGRRAVAVPTVAGLPVEIGDRVDVLATFDTGATGVEPTVVVARDALVVAHEDDAVTIAVEQDVAPRVAYALAVGTITLALSG
jgi:Flp pilus assembly protein CpaB